MSNSIDRDLLLDLLDKWETGSLGEEQLHLEAESLWDAGGEWPILPKRDPRSIAVEVLSNLDSMNVGFIGREDIPAMRTFLRTPAGGETDAWNAWESYWAKIDFGQRQKSLGANGYYRDT
jgi:hypothetical protein